MNITTGEIKNILKTLPIGYYCGRKINVSLDENSATSCYSPITDEIIISSQIIQKGLEKAVETSDFTRETAVRSMLYHELSHAILTPSEWRPCEITNIFEDERIETLLKGYYLDTNFKQNLQNISGDVTVDFNDPKQAFYSTVRFRTGKPQFVQRVDEIIDKYDYLNSSSSQYIADHYDDEIMELYEAIREDIEQNPMSEEEQSQMNQMLQNNLDSMADEEEQMMKDNQEKRASKKPNVKSGQNDGNDNGHNENNSEDDGDGNGQNQMGYGRENGEDDNEGEDGEKVLGKKAGFNLLKNALSNSTEVFHDKELAQRLAMIFDNFNKRNNNGNSTVSYNGRINPRNFAREDYKYFDKKISINGNNKYGTCHLNLFIDDSGSFSPNAHAVNVLLAELTRLESKNDNFTFDLIRCGNGMMETDKTNRFIEANSGTSLEFEETKRIFRKHQKKNTFVYNIVLYDGDCNGYGKDKLGYFHPFKYFDTKNTTMILESSNEYIISHCDMNSANIIYENYNYAGLLTKNILNALERAFR